MERIIALLTALGAGTFIPKVFGFLTTRDRMKAKRAHDERDSLNERDAKLWARMDEIDERREAEIAGLRGELGDLRDENTMLRANLEGERQKRAQLEAQVLTLQSSEHNCAERVRQLERENTELRRRVRDLEMWLLEERKRAEHEGGGQP